jgi:peptidoglycan-N-acetylmuramic acid deacetylase
MGYTTVFWSFAYADWNNEKQPDPKASLQKLLDHLHNGEILLLHPTSATNAAILDEFLTQAKEQGYRFGSLTELCQK